MMGSISYVKNNEDMLTHLDAVAKNLNKGGLYLIENFRLDWPKIVSFAKPEGWDMERKGIKVETIYQIKIKDTIKQLLEESFILKINDHGKKHNLSEKIITKMMFPEEFTELVKNNGKFEFIGWFERNRMRPLNKANMYNIVILRRK